MAIPESTVDGDPGAVHPDALPEATSQADML